MSNIMKLAGRWRTANYEEREETRAELEVAVAALENAAQQALEALDSVAGKGKLCNTAITALTTALKGTP